MKRFEEIPKNHCYLCKHFLSTASPCCILGDKKKINLSRDGDLVDVINGIVDNELMVPNFHNANLECKRFNPDRLRNFFSKWIGGDLYYYPFIFPDTIYHLWVEHSCFVVFNLCILLLYFKVKSLPNQAWFLLTLFIISTSLLIACMIRDWVCTSDFKNKIRRADDETSKQINDEINSRIRHIRSHYKYADWKFSISLAGFSGLNMSKYESVEKLEVLQKELEKRFPDKRINFEAEISPLFYR